MKRYSARSGHSAMAELNVTPLLDLAFVLLIIFIITTPLLESNVPMQLPVGPVHNNQPLDPKSVRTVSIDARGQVYLDQTPVELPELQAELTAFQQTTPDAAVIIRADKGLRYQQVVDVVNVLQAAQISRMHLENVTP
jgi:biopolymer transport protein ExbD